ncbi:uncharacterized protein CCOS01_17109 [Colletotrichum costaricense]|uniref:Uncharacterized protein n=1 Tax=Colletotrichum costaricense TaxID=1209916 RepID=A0AAI9YEG0_9PEZI|nr:uncharacterized protein CCOS01_17109 [Colletotrichum costaricense]KAK1502582.1 hypothetical protein CCOS01_17109 [Colletotrichum costaricense]
MHRPQPRGPGPHRNNSGQPQNRQPGPYPRRNTAAAQPRKQHQQPATARHSKQMNNSFLPLTQAVYDSANFDEASYEFQEAEDSTAQPIAPQFQHSASPTSDPCLMAQEDLTASIAQNTAWNSEIEERIDRALDVVKRLHKVITQTAAAAQPPAFVEPQLDVDDWNTHDTGGLSII